jgi:hypothetical protein
VPPPAPLTRAAVGVLAAALLAGCSGSPRTTAATVTAPMAQPVSAPVTVPALRAALLRPDVLVVGRLTSNEVRAVSHLAPAAVAYTIGTVRIGRTAVRVASVDPMTFRRYTAQGTAQSTPVWQTVAAGELVASHAAARRLGLRLGSIVTMASGTRLPLRLGALATTGIPGTDLVVDTATGIRLGLAGSTAVLLTAGRTDPVGLASRARHAAGKGAQVELLTAPAASPMAFLTGSRAAHAFGAFSYTYYADGTIVPDARWVRANIVTVRVPILGLVTCHRLMIPQLRGALTEIKRDGLAGSLHTYNGCYVPRFIERNPSHAISLHTWGIAIDIDAATNYRGIRGTMDPRVVAIFKRWGFRWGGDWAYTDPMHFELGALLR